MTVIAIKNDVLHKHDADGNRTWKQQSHVRHTRSNGSEDRRPGPSRKKKSIAVHENTILGGIFHSECRSHLCCGDLVSDYGVDEFCVGVLILHKPCASTARALPAFGVLLLGLLGMTKCSSKGGGRSEPSNGVAAENFQ